MVKDFTCNLDKEKIRKTVQPRDKTSKKTANAKKAGS